MISAVKWSFFNRAGVLYRLRFQIEDFLSPGAVIHYGGRMTTAQLTFVLGSLVPMATTAIVRGQTPDTQRPTGGELAFDAASVKLAGPEVPQPYTITGGPGTNDPSRFRAPNISLFDLIPRAFGLSTDQIVGPPWLRDLMSSSYFTVIATMPPDTTKEQFQVMLQNLIVERFHLAFHHGVRNFPGYELVVDKGGTKFREVMPTQDGGPASKGTLMIQNGKEFPDLPGPRTITLSNGGLKRTKYQERSIADFVWNLGFLIGSSEGKSVLDGEHQPRVIDRTGLTGKYTFILEYYSAGSAAVAARFSNGADQAPLVASDPAESGPTIFEAIQKQLGLRLNKTGNVPLDVIVVDSVEKLPTPN
jgi:uncharacterized protein (TIGR03435 family)